MAETCKKKSKTHEGDEDLISQLPDEVLAHILSFVNTNSAVATSVLSKRWKLVWIFVPNLEFDYSSSIPTYEWALRHACLCNLVDRVLSLNNVASVRSVRLQCSPHSNDVSRMNVWFKSLVLRKAEKFHLHLGNCFRDENLLSSNMSLPPEGFFDQKNLVELNLANVILKVPSTVCFPRLKTMIWNHVQLCGDGEPMKNLLSGCPAITDLVLLSEGALPEEGARYKKLYICSSTLRNIKIDASCDEIVIDTPNVRCLDLKIQLATPGIGGSPLVKIGMLHNVTRMTLHGIDAVGDEVASWLWRLLDCTPTGVSIIFNMVMSYYPDYAMSQSLNLPDSIISCIQSVRITETNGSWQTYWAFVAVITCNLKNATGWKKLTFHGVPMRRLETNEFLKKFLPVSDEWKTNNAYVHNFTS